MPKYIYLSKKTRLINLVSLKIFNIAIKIFLLGAYDRQSPLLRSANLINYSIIFKGVKIATHKKVNMLNRWRRHVRGLQVMRLLVISRRNWSYITDLEPCLKILQQHCHDKKDPPKVTSSNCNSLLSHT